MRNDETFKKNRWRLARGGVSRQGLDLLFVRVTNAAKLKHEGVLNQLRATSLLDGQFQMEAFRVRTFLSPNYDALTNSAEAIRTQCGSLLSGADAITHVYGEIFDLTLREYCDDVDDRIEVAEQLKSNVSVLRNSAHFIPELSSNALFTQDTAEAKLAFAVLVSTLSYISDSSTDRADRLDNAIWSLVRGVEKRTVRNPAAETLLSHARIVEELTPKIDGLLAEISYSADRDKFLAVQPAYLQAFEDLDQRSRLFQSWLLLAFFGVVVLATFLLLKLWRSSEALAVARQNLATRAESEEETPAARALRVLARRT